MLDQSKLPGHTKYIESLLGNNFATFFNKIYSRFDLKELAELKQLLENKYPKLGEGSSRAVYALSDTLTIKIPSGCKNYQWAEISANLTESILYKRLKKRNIFTSTKLYFYKSIPVLISERVTPLSYPERYSYAGHEFDGMCDGSRQIGKNKEGKLLCFDFGLEERMLTPKIRDLKPKELKAYMYAPRDVSPFLV